MSNKMLKIKLISIFTSAIFISVVVFGFIFMMDMSVGKGENMTAQCPFSLPGNEFCPTDDLGVVTHHISSFQSFFNILISKSIWLGAIITFSILWLFGRQLFLNQDLYLSFLAKHRIKRWLPSLRLNNLIKWLALFVNSPSFSYKT